MQLDSIRILWVARYNYQPNKILCEHKHNYWQLFYIVDGIGMFNFGQRTYDIGPNMIFLVRPNQTHGFSVASEDMLRTIDIKFHLYGDITQKFSRFESVVGHEMLAFKGLFEKIHYEGVQKSSLYQEMSRVYLWEIILSLLRECGESYLDVYDVPNPENIQNVNDESLEPPISQEIKNYIEENYHDDINLKDISEHLSYHQGYLCTVFKKNNECTIMQYLYKYRIEKSKELILYSDYSLKEIAFMVGFKSIHHFTRLFNELEGETPGNFRRKERDKIGKDIYFDDTFINYS